MKRILTVISALICLCFSWVAGAQNTYLVPDPQNAKWSYVETDANGKETARYFHSVESLKGDGINGTLKLKVETVSHDTPSETGENAIFYRFKDGEFMVDLNAIFEGDMLAGLVKEAVKEESADLSDDKVNEAIEMVKSQFKVSGEIRGIPRYPTIGKLPDFEFHFKFSIVNMKVTAEDRKIVCKEKLQTAAGTYDCFIMDETITTNVMMTKEVEKTRSWYAHGIGLVKEITYDKNGKAVSTMVLDSVNW